MDGVIRSLFISGQNCLFPTIQYQLKVQSTLLDNALARDTLNLVFLKGGNIHIQVTGLLKTLSLCD
jgi:hypothetical protein